MKTKKNYSFSRYVIIQFAIYTLIILGVTIVTYFLINWRLSNSFLVLDDFLEYKDKLEYEDYAGIPMSKFPGCDFAVYDNNNELIYTTDGNTEDAVLGSDLIFVNDYSNVYYDIFNYRNKENKKVYKIYETKYNDELSDEVVVGNAELDEYLNVLEGTLFKSNDTLTDRELNLLYGYYNDEQMVEKYEFTTNYDYDIENENRRTLLFMSPVFNSESYDAAVASSEKIWFIAIPVLILLIIIETYFFNKKVKESLDVLKNIVTSYEENGSCERYKKLPREFEEVASRFENLMEKSKKLENDKIKIYEDRQKIIANLSHDLKTPLTVIQGYSKAFLDNLVPDDKKEQYLKTIYKKSIVATDAIVSLFMYAHLNHPEYGLSLENVDIVMYSKNYLAEKYNEIESNSMKLDVDIKIDKLNIDIDTKNFRRIYENLINNSIKYNKKDTKIYFKMWVDKNLYISIGDNGVGIDANIKDNIFEAFVTSNSARTSGNGTGLGLSIVKNLVELHNGEIELVKKPKKPLKTEFLIKIKL